MPTTQHRMENEGQNGACRDLWPSLLLWKVLDTAGSSSYMSPPWMASPGHFPSIFSVTQNPGFLTRSTFLGPAFFISLISSLFLISHTGHLSHEGKK